MNNSFKMMRIIHNVKKEQYNVNGFSSITIQ